MSCAQCLKNLLSLIFQTIAKSLGGNPYGCWNWFGYLNDLLFESYAKRDAEQMAGTFRMVQRAAGI